jgi:hypothetical protein
MKRSQCKVSDGQMYEAMVTENELGGLIEAAMTKIGPKGTWEAFNEAVGRSVPVGTQLPRGKMDGGFEKVRAAYFRGEGLGRIFLVNFLPCGHMRSATINEIINARYGLQRAANMEEEANDLDTAAAAATDVRYPL